VLDTGYVDVFAKGLRSIRPTLTVVNYGCPGESTTTFIAGPCLYNTLGLSLHEPFAGSQLDATAAFLHAHPGRVSPITLTLWANDAAAAERMRFDPCHDPPLVAKASHQLWRLQGFSMGGAGLEPATPSLSSWCSPN
jgi:hypothetical protein